jgi:hypothetical protein
MNQKEVDFGFNVAGTKNQSEKNISLSDRKCN